jgi:Ca-activated chloride channel family protein
MTGMKSKQRRFALFVRVMAVFFVVTAIVVVIQVGSLVGLFLTPDQQAQRLVDRGQYKEAAAQFSDPMRKGIALYRAGEYESAARAFSHFNTAQGHFNRGNALVMLGSYDDAVKAFDRSLQLLPNWAPATENREIARLRGERTRQEGGDMTGGKLGADDIVIEPGKGKKQLGQTEVTSGGGEMSDQELQALWLRRVETKPADFLRAKFAFQHAHTSRDKKTTGKQ